MPIHDWTRVDAGIFHSFHHRWISAISDALNAGLLPPDHYALAERIAGGLGPDVLTLQRPTKDVANGGDSPAGVAVATVPPKVQYHLRAESDLYAAKAKAVVIRHISSHRVIAVVEIVSPGNKNSRHGVRSFVSKTVELLQAGIHLLLLDLFPIGPRDPQGIHKLIWDEFIDHEFALSADKPLSVMAYIGGTFPEVFLEPLAVGLPLPEMPVFLDPDIYVPLPLQATYDVAWQALPSFWRDVVQSSANG
jgi:hypothetical protein